MLAVVEVRLGRHRRVVGAAMAVEVGAAAVGGEQRCEHRRIGEHEHPAGVEQDGVEAQVDRTVGERPPMSASGDQVGDVDPACLEHVERRRQVVGIEARRCCREGTGLGRRRGDSAGRRAARGGEVDHRIARRHRRVGSTPDVTSTTAESSVTMAPDWASRATIASSTCSGPTPQVMKTASAAASSVGAATRFGDEQSTAALSSPRSSNTAAAVAASSSTASTPRRRRGRLGADSSCQAWPI